MTNERVPPAGSLVRRVLYRGLAGALLLAFFVALALGAPVCPSAGFLGIPCPGCGLTRATLALLSGDVRGALELHPLVFVATPGFAALLAYASYATFRRSPRPRASARTTRLVTWSAAALVVLLLSVWLARFAGYFGGPVKVTTYAEWARRLKN